MQAIPMEDRPRNCHRRSLLLVKKQIDDIQKLLNNSKSNAALSKQLIVQLADILSQEHKILTDKPNNNNTSSIAAEEGGSQFEGDVQEKAKVLVGRLEAFKKAVVLKSKSKRLVSFVCRTCRSPEEFLHKRDV
jgi:hypothetical protein